MILDMRESSDEVKKSLYDSEAGLPTGITDLDNVLGGLQSGELISVGGRPSMGKSSLARDILLSVGKPTTNFGASVLFTLEMSCYEVAELLATNLAKIDYSSFKRGNPTDRVKSQLDTACNQLSSYRIIINDDSYTTPDTIRESLLTVQAKEPIACLVVDYLQLMSLRKRIENRQEEISEISRELKAIAKDFNIPVISFSQLNRNVEYRESSRPRMADLRESGAMENDSSKIILIHRPSYYDKQIDQNAVDTGEAELIVCKNRKGKTGVVKCVWIDSWMSFKNIEETF